MTKRILDTQRNSPGLEFETATREQHRDLIVPWLTLGSLQQLELVDSYRQIHPEPQRYPGITWDTKGKKDEHRIDYIFYRGRDLKAISSESYKAHFGYRIDLGDSSIPYPSDHGIVLTTFVLAAGSP